MRVVFLNSGGVDCELALNLYKKVNPNAEILSFNIETGDTLGMQKAEELAVEYELGHFLLPYEETRKHIRHPKNISGREASTASWSFEMHWKAIQYAQSHGYDAILSGHEDYRHIHGDLEHILSSIMGALLMSEPIIIIRPLKHAKTIEDYRRLAELLGDKVPQRVKEKLAKNEWL